MRMTLFLSVKTCCGQTEAGSGHGSRVEDCSSKGQSSCAMIYKVVCAVLEHKVRLTSVSHDGLQEVNGDGIPLIVLKAYSCT